METLEDLCIPIAKIRLVADLLRIDKYHSSAEYGMVEIPGQSIVGVHYTLSESIDKIESIAQKELDEWNDERDEHRKTIEELKNRIRILEGRADHA